MRSADHSRQAARILAGLSHAEAARRLVEDGPNELAVARRRSLVDIMLETGREPLFLLLIGAALLYLVLGDIGEGLFLVAGAMAAVSLVVFQEARSERALAALRDLAQPQARVIRDGVEMMVAARDLVRGDILLVGEGERAPADALLRSGDVLSVDESTLSGESAPVTKRVAAPDEGFPADIAPGPETGPFLFAGTLIVRGQGVCEVAHTGARSALGRIGASLAGIAQEATPLQQTAGRLVALLGAVALAFCAVVAVAYGVLRNDWIGGALAGITVAISLIPEEFPMVLAAFLALGAWRLARHGVLTRRSAVIETLGAATVLCVDKTGTLTENTMRVARLWTPSAERYDVTGKPPAHGEAAALIRLARRASAVRPVDPMDRALDRLAPTAVDTADGPERSWPLRPELLAVIQSWRLGENEHIAVAKGAPEAIFGLCRLVGSELERVHGVVAAFAEDGLRVLGVASATSQEPVGDDPAVAPYVFAGLVGFEDPIRENVRAALDEARMAGVKVVMITGDHPATALAIARSAGIDTAAGVLTGADVAQLPFPTLCQRLKTVRVFARIAPEQKLLLVEAFRTDGETVAMTGDGVNDAPALEAAHIGIAMGRRGTDVAREAADLVLLDDSFASIVGGVRLGRRIFSNLRNALTFITAVHVPIAGLALAPILVGLPPLLFPMHVVLLELAIDPICALVFEAERSEPGAMRRPPRRRDEALFGPAQVALALAQGAGQLLAVFALYVLALASHSEEQARGAAFAALVLCALTLALADSFSSGRLFDPRRAAYWLIAGGVLLILFLSFAVPSFAQVFRIAPPGWDLLAMIATAVVLGGAWGAALRFAAGRVWTCFQGLTKKLGFTGQSGRFDRSGRSRLAGHVHERPSHLDHQHEGGRGQVHDHHRSRGNASGASQGPRAGHRPRSPDQRFDHAGGPRQVECAPRGGANARLLFRGLRAPDEAEAVQEPRGGQGLGPQGQARHRAGSVRARVPHHRT
jgi:P-type Ca2+ transporter type 2C